MAKKSGVEYLAQHSGWKTKERDTKKNRTKEKAPELYSAVKDLIEAADHVVECWEGGDLAGAVNVLEAQAKDAQSLVDFIEGGN
jgi:hypothetical protein